MRRRDALLGLTGALAARPALAQQKRLPLVVFLSPGKAGDYRVAGFQEGLREVSLVDGRDIQVEYVFSTPDRFAVDVDAVVARNPDVVFAVATPLSVAMKRASTRIPIVASSVADPIATGLAESLARPGANVTGHSNMGVDLAAKNLQLLKESMPGLMRVGILGNPVNPVHLPLMKEALRAAEVLRLEAQIFETDAGRDIEAVFKTMVSAGVQAVSILADSWILNIPTKVGELAANYRLAIQVHAPEAVAPGILLAYGPNLSVIFRRSVHLMAKIVRGTKPADIPFEQPTHFDLVLHMPTAKALGIEFPLGILYRATEIIE